MNRSRSRPVYVALPRMSLAAAPAPRVGTPRTMAARHAATYTFAIVFLSIFCPNLSALHVPTPAESGGIIAEPGRGIKPALSAKTAIEWMPDWTAWTCTMVGGEVGSGG
jgi:hypothetical protein